MALYLLFSDSIKTSHPANCDIYHKCGAFVVYISISFGCRRGGEKKDLNDVSYPFHGYDTSGRTDL